MVARGRIQNGVVVLEGGVTLPEGASVIVEILEKPIIVSPELQALAGRAVGLPPDASENLDHYLYGAPKRPPTPPPDAR